MYFLLYYKCRFCFIKPHQGRSRDRHTTADNLSSDSLKHTDLHLPNLYTCKRPSLSVTPPVSLTALSEYTAINKMHFKTVVKSYPVSVFRMKLRVGNYKVFITNSFQCVTAMDG